MTAIICAVQAGTENAALLGMGIGAVIFIIMGLVILSIILGGVFMLIGAGVANVEGRNFGKAIVASLFAGLGGSFAGGIIALIPFIGPFLAFFANIVVQIFIIKAVFATETGKAILTWLFNLIAQIIVLIIATIIFWGTIAGMLFAVH